MTNAISVKERLKKQAIEDGKTMQDKLVTYGLERTIYRLSVSKYAEKFEAFVSLGLANGRYKDFYDIYVLADSYDLDGMELMKAIVDTFTHRGTSFNEIAAFDDDFTKDEIRQGRCKTIILFKIGVDYIYQYQNLLQYSEENKKIPTDDIKVEYDAYCERMGYIQQKS